MITISSTMRAILSGAHLETFVLLMLGTYYRTSYPRDLTSMGRLFESDGTILQMEPPQLGSVVDRQMFKMVLSDVSIPLSSMAETGMTGLSVRVYIGIVDPATSQPLLAESDLLLINAGRVDSPSLSIKTDTVGEKTFTLSCSSPMTNLDMTKAMYTSQDYLSKNYPGDTSYEQIFEGSGPLGLKWGRK